MIVFEIFKIWVTLKIILYVCYVIHTVYKYGLVDLTYININQRLIFVLPVVGEYFLYKNICRTFF
jgi:hypothetical protein